jgi:hypothetical protein
MPSTDPVPRVSTFEAGSSATNLLLAGRSLPHTDRLRLIGHEYQPCVAPLADSLVISGQADEYVHRAASSAASTASPSRSTILSTSPVVLMKGGASRTWSPLTPSTVPPIG